MNKDLEALQQELKQTQLAYQQAVTTSQFKAGFLARVAHELRSPLNGMIGMHQLILSDLCDSPEEEREFVAQAHQSALNMLQLLDHILEVARLEYGSRQLEIQPLQLASVLSKVHQLTHVLAQDRNFPWQLTLPPTDVYVLADPKHLIQLLVSLVETVIQFTEEGPLHLSAQVHPETAMAEIWLDAAYPASLWQESIVTLQTKRPPGQVMSDRLSPGMRLLMHQTLLELMQGRLEVVVGSTDSTPATAASPLMTRLQCSVPLVIPEDDASY